jgi:ATP-dependent Clp protease ATP-binding subunit ClpC
VFERYTARGHRVLFFARIAASESSHPLILPEHLLLGLLRDSRSTAARLLSAVPAELIRHQVDTEIGRGHTPIAAHLEIPLADSSKSVLQRAADEADRLRHSHIGTQHLLLGLLADAQSSVARLLGGHGVTVEHVRAAAAAEPDPEPNDRGSAMYPLR